MAKIRYVFELDDDGSATLQIGDNAPITVVDYKVTFDRPVEAVDPGDVPAIDPWVRYVQAEDGEFTLSGKLKFDSKRAA